MLHRLLSIEGLPWTPDLPRHFTDLTDEDFRAMVMRIDLSAHMASLTLEAPPASSRGHPDAYDFYGAYPSCAARIHDQGHCASCWAFSSVGVFADRQCREGIVSSHTPLFMEYLLFCSTVNDGCRGGYPSHALDFLVAVGVPTNRCFAYSPLTYFFGEVPDCPTVCEDGSAIECSRAVRRHAVSGDADAMAAEIYRRGPIQAAMTIYADFKYYAGGVYRHAEGAPYGEHTVILVGYGVDAHTGCRYWRARNSWGPDWGEDGYFRLERGTNECGIERAYFYVNVK